MPFQYVWQYQNTETTVLAQDIVDIINANNLLPFDCSQCSGGGGSVNAAGYIPTSDGLVFNNSWLRTKDAFNNPVLTSEFATFPLEGIELLPLVRRYTLGNFSNSPADFGLGYVTVFQDLTYGSYAAVGLAGGHSVGVSVGPLGEVINLNGGVAFTAGAPLGWYLEILVNGNPCKIELLNM